MRLEHYPPEKLARELLDIFGRHLDLTKYRAFFFGSRVTGMGNDRSDIDVGIEGPASVPNGTLATIREEVDALRTLYTIEVVDFTTTSDAFRRVAKERIESLEEIATTGTPS